MALYQLVKTRAVLAFYQLARTNKGYAGMLPAGNTKDELALYWLARVVLALYWLAKTMVVQALYFLGKYKSCASFTLVGKKECSAGIIPIGKNKGCGALYQWEKITRGI